MTKQNRVYKFKDFWRWEKFLWVTNGWLKFTLEVKIKSSVKLFIPISKTRDGPNVHALQASIHTDVFLRLQISVPNRQVTIHRQPPPADPRSLQWLNRDRRFSPPGKVRHGKHSEVTGL